MTPRQGFINARAAVIDMDDVELGQLRALPHSGTTPFIAKTLGAVRAAFNAVIWLTVPWVTPVAEPGLEGLVATGADTGEAGATTRTRLAPARARPCFVVHVVASPASTHTLFSCMHAHTFSISIFPRIPGRAGVCCPGSGALVGVGHDRS